tara:strand:- start:109 stop:456 length:348 start_codon:yes stop_codon:yes gene_type:complete
MMMTYDNSFKFRELTHGPFVVEQKDIYCVKRVTPDSDFDKFLSKNAEHIRIVTQRNVSHWHKFEPTVYLEFAFRNPRVETLFQIAFSDESTHLRTMNLGRHCTWKERIKDLWKNR